MLSNTHIRWCQFLFQSGVAAVALISASANAFQINPVESADEIRAKVKPRHAQWIDSISSPAHERMARLSFTCAKLVDEGQQCSVDEKMIRSTLGSSEGTILWGVRWNDDPNNFFRDDRIAVKMEWLFWLTEAQWIGVKRIDPLEYRSHYGDLQFLHAMGSKGATAVQTQQDVVSWFHFAYDVATGEIQPGSTLGSLATTYDFPKRFSGTSKERWTVKMLFTNIGDLKNYGEAKATDAEIAVIAAGAMLHTIQDSFSKSHTDRWDENPTDGSPPYSIKAWLDYSKQNPNCHKPEDKEPDWLAKDESGRPAIMFGATVIRKASAKRPWEELEPLLKSMIFPMAKATRNSDGGGFKRCAMVT